MFDLIMAQIEIDKKVLSFHRLRSGGCDLEMVKATIVGSKSTEIVALLIYEKISFSKLVTASIRYFAAAS